MSSLNNCEYENREDVRNRLKRLLDMMEQEIEIPREMLSDYRRFLSSYTNI